MACGKKKIATFELIKSPNHYQATNVWDAPGPWIIERFPHPGNTNTTSSNRWYIFIVHEVEIASYNHDPSLDPTRDGSQVALPLAATKGQRDMTSNRPVKIGWKSLGNLKIRCVATIYFSSISFKAEQISGGEIDWFWMANPQLHWANPWWFLILTAGGSIQPPVTVVLSIWQAFSKMNYEFSTRNFRVEMFLTKCHRFHLAVTLRDPLIQLNMWLISSTTRNIILAFQNFKFK